MLTNRIVFQLNMGYFLPKIDRQYKSHTHRYVYILTL